MSTTSTKTVTPLTIGVLALQGAYEAHALTLRSLRANTRLVRLPADLEGLDGLVMPGGESTTMLRFLEQRGFFDSLKGFVHKTPTFGTCAGVILLAKDVLHPAQKSLGALDVTVERNAYGRQIDSTILHAESRLPGPPLEMVFIRAPRITRTGPNVETLATRNDDPVLVREGHLLAATFHPELGHDRRVHQLFLDLVRSHKEQLINTPAM
ncbi:pyridoxal 5'-phosphate synthase glutaminase subunit PdxT [Edaphobacter flagellatus]|uniref:pyridoxal 5'-phosphate synthase glutaminase subunit PdxT n=1 Tax=Edaphobacter flagellatus TaxID=1933044 RepID=UPI0021B3367C|nr:pyridoxal 5'-phosphate synthase glutaminase subunit PdxT [Edaphobacter flagellatus]